MRRLSAVGLIALAVLVIWTGVIGAGVVEGWWLQPIAPRDDTGGFAKAAIGGIDRAHKGNVAFVLIKARNVVAQHYASVGKPVNGETLFQVASLSKWITAWGIMTLVDAGKLKLDVPVSTYLRRWH